MNAEDLVLSYYKPQVVNGDARDRSTFSGSAFLLPGEEWPRCAGCRTPMQLFVQLLTDELPVATPWSRSAVQLFYCTDENCEPAMDAWDPLQNKAKLVRTIPVEGSVAAERPGDDAFPAKTVMNWFEHPDYPEDANLLDEDADEELQPAGGDKLGGWPMWVQGEEYPDCPKCGEQMDYLFQIDSEDNLPYMFGDSGCGHITYCAKHPDVLMFGWACC